ncbi:MAG: MoaD/ThiS family protein [Thermoproteota archaeon]
MVEMKVEVKYYAWYREDFGPSEIIDIGEDSTVRQLVEKLKDRHPILDEEQFMIVVNGRIDELNARLNEGDRIAIFPPAGGG